MPAAFKAAYSEARQATFEAGMTRVQALTAKAIDTLDELLDAKDYPNVRLGAARTLAEIGLHQHDADAVLVLIELATRRVQVAGMTAASTACR